MKKGFKAAIFTALFTVGAAITSFAGSWQSDGVTYKYLKDDGTYAVNEWQSKDGLWYHLDGSGVLQTGWILDAGKWYYLEPNGAMRTTELLENGKVFYFDATGACTNPDGGSVAVVPEEEAYVYKVIALFTDVEAAGNMFGQQTAALGEGDFAGAKQILLNLKTPFNNFLAVVAPPKYSAVDVKLKSGCRGMMNLMDSLCLMIDGALNGTVTESNIDTYLASMEQILNGALKDFEDATILMDIIM